MIKNNSHFQALFDQIHQENIHFDIITFCETWLNDNLCHSVNFENYNSVFKHKTAVKEGGGLAVFIREGIPYTVREDLSFNDELLDKFDGLLVELDGLNIIVCIIYRTPRFQSIPELTLHLIDKITTIKRENKQIIIPGDLNIDLLKYSHHYETTDFLDQMLIHNLIPKITVPTRLTETSSTLIDHIFTNIDKHDCTAGTLITDISDHFSNFFISKINSQPQHLPHTVTYRPTNDHLIENLNRCLSEYDWNDVTSTLNVDEAYNIFINKITDAINKHLPMKTIKFNKNKHKGNPWITRGILNSLKTKEKLYIKMMKSAGMPSFNYNQNKYNTYKMIYTKMHQKSQKPIGTTPFNNRKIT